MLRAVVRIGVMVLALVVSVSAQTPAKPSPGAALIGKKVPALTLSDFSGKTSTLASHLGKPTFISFWASWCGPCLKEMPELNAALAAHKGEFQVLAIDMGDQLAAAENARKTRMAFDFQWFIDPEWQGNLMFGTKLGKAFSIPALPTAVWIAVDGTVIDYWNGLPDGEGALTKKIDALLARGGK